MDKVRKSNPKKNELIELILEKSFGEYLSWQPPKLIRTVGPYSPDAFDKFYGELKNAIAVCLSPLKLCHQLMVTGGFKDGTETVFGRRCSKGLLL